ncbi:MAG: hypothetical protein JWR21_90 [Herminiimonas sp.]|nr:hypothetical protein [Herminiimonas sp.]
MTLIEYRDTHYTVDPYSIDAAMKWRVKLMRKAGRRIPWKVLINERGMIGSITTHYCEYADQERYKVAALMCGPLRCELELIEPQLLALGDQALILRGYERLVNDEGPFTVLQEWRCEPT